MSLEEQAKKRVMTEMSANAIPMSKSDQVVIRRSQADVPGVYVSADQRQQDAYADAMTMQEQLGVMNGMGLAAASAPQQIQNPNVRIETTGQNVTALADGTIVYY